MKKKYRDCPCTPCGIIISGDLPMCAKHWELVPAAQRDAIFEAKRKGNFRASREALVKAVIHVNAELKPTGPTLPTLLTLLAFLLFSNGCMVARYTRLPACACAGTNDIGGVRFSVYTCLVNEKVAKITVDKFTGKTHSGITIGAVEQAVDDDALKAIVSAAVEATIKAFIPLP